MKISISGKGGSGKTTIAGTLARAFARLGYPVLAIDGDSNPNLAITLGLNPEAASQTPVLPGDLLKSVTDEQGNTTRVLSLGLEEIVSKFGAQAADQVQLLAMKRIDHAGAG